MSSSIFTTRHDEILDADEICDAATLDALRATLDEQSRQLPGIVARLARRLERFLLAQQRRSWQFDVDEGTQYGMLRRGEGRLIVDGIEQCRQRLGEPLVEESAPAIDQRSSLLRHGDPRQALAHQQGKRLGHRRRAVGRAAQHAAALQVIAQRGVHIGRDAHQVAGAHGLTADVLQRIEQRPRAGARRSVREVGLRIMERAPQGQSVGLTPRQRERLRRQVRRCGRQQHLVALEARPGGTEDDLQIAVGGERARGGSQRPIEGARHLRLAAGRGAGAAGGHGDLRGP